MSKFAAFFATIVLSLSTAFAANPITVPPGFEPQLDPIKTSITVTCQNQLLFIVIVFEDGTVTIYDKDSGVPADTALWTASKAKKIEGREVCLAPGSFKPSVKL